MSVTYWVSMCAMIGIHGYFKGENKSNFSGQFQMPKCSACDFGKGQRRPDKINTVKKNPMKNQDLNNNHILSVNIVY